ncbi:hypothetical protein VTK73DRAFT_5299 [Phialemonium thermophilum]|uniref:Uncharacterized protein n=1 Tax=Phialemonium thermophilum TaxID=223376 RepID=A0ABR3V255_9PEZI
MPLFAVCYILPEVPDASAEVVALPQLVGNPQPHQAPIPLPLDPRQLLQPPLPLPLVHGPDGGPQLVPRFGVVRPREPDHGVHLLGRVHEVPGAHVVAGPRVHAGRARLVGQEGAAVRSSIACAGALRSSVVPTQTVQ